MVDQTSHSSLTNNEEVQPITDAVDSGNTAPPVILVMTRNGRLTDAVTDYVLSVAERLSYRLLVVDVDTLPQLRNTRQRSKERTAISAAAMAALQQKTAEKNIRVDFVAESGSVSKVIHNICHIVKRVKFVVIDKGIKLEMASARSPVPVFHIVSDHIHVARSGTRYRQTIDTINFPRQNQSQWQAWTKSLLLAVGICALYGIIGARMETIMDYWTRGGPYAILAPLTTVVFCCLQISFANAFRNALAGTRHHAKQEKERQRYQGRKQPIARLSPTHHNTKSSQAPS